MAFSDTDPLESDMKVRCEDMTADQLVAYLKEWQHAVNGIALKLDGQEWRRMSWLQGVYGQRDAGDIIKWICYHHRGKVEGQMVTHRRFNSKMKWWVDKIHIEMQQARHRESRRQLVSTSSGSSSFATSL